MDLRVQKTKKAIINAFLELRAVKPLNKITITELTQKAVISKATFYLHYKDIYDLSEQLQNELIADVIKEIPHPETIITEPKQHVGKLLTAFKSQAPMIDILFQDYEISNLANRIEYYIKEEIYRCYPKLKDDTKINIALTFAIQGGFYAYKKYSKNNTDTVMNCISNISEIIVENILQGIDIE